MRDAATRLLNDRGRQAATAVLLAALALTQISALADPLRHVLFDAYERLSPRLRQSDPAVIVAIDDDSLATVSQWPWPRQLEARLIQTILAAKPAALGIDILWPEPDRTSPAAWLQGEDAVPEDLSAQLRRLPDHDLQLADALASGPVAIGIAGTRGTGARADGKLAPVRIAGEDPAPYLPQFSGLMRSLPDLDDSAAGHGLLSVDADGDGTIRRIPLISDINGRMAPGLGLETLRLAAHAVWIGLSSASGGLRGVTVGPLTIPIQRDGSVWIDFSPHDPRRFVSAADVLAGRVDPEIFSDRLVLLGVTGLGLVDLPATPLGRMPGVEVHAQFLENVMEGKLAARPVWAAAAEAASGAGFGLLLILLLPGLPPRWFGLAWAAPSLALAATGFAAWHWQRWLIDGASPIAVFSLVFLTLLSASFAQADAQRRRLRKEIEIRKIETARVDGELQAARRIQMGILPAPSNLPADPRLDLDACVMPAREVGGDLYDFFMIDENRLFFSIGDVSGKGVPASLFMAIGKTLCKSSALRGDGAIGDIVIEANAEISRDNSEMLFITLFAGVLDLSTGLAQICNAGHDAPLLLRQGELVQASAGEGGPPLCVLDGFPYPVETIRLLPGDILCLFTDGVTEAMDRDGALMGRERAEAALKALPTGGGASAALHALCGAVEDFAKGAEPADDLTVLALRWRGPVSAP